VGKGQGVKAGVAEQGTIVAQAMETIQEQQRRTGDYQEAVEAIAGTEKSLQPVLFGDLGRQRRVRSTDLAQSTITKAMKRKKAANDEAQRLLNEFLARLRSFRVLDPACGSGNFLYLALYSLKDFEHRVLLEAEALGFERPVPSIGPDAVLGIEINPYAAELARISVWIGEIQWMLRSGFEVGRNPILKSLNNIECRDALLNPDGRQASWPTADVVIGNPPFLGDKMMIGALGEEYTKRLRSAYDGRVPGGADLVCYWFAIADQFLREGHVHRAGFVATNSIRGGANRMVLESIRKQHVITDAWADEEWSIDGAAVRVSLVCFATQDAPIEGVSLNNLQVLEIFADLTGGRTDLTSAKSQSANKGLSYQGTIKVGAFDISGDTARDWLALPYNPNGRPNGDVVRPWSNGQDITRRASDTWIIDFGVAMSMDEAMLYEQPFLYAEQEIYQKRQGKREARASEKWWILQRARPEMRNALSPLSRYIATPRVAKYRLFVWINHVVLPDCQLVVIARDDDTAFGILHGRYHQLWALRLGSSLEDRPRYTPSTTFETFPFPEGLTPNIPAVDYANDPRAQRIAAAAKRLDELRENWLNPSDLVRREPEVVPGYPDRILPVDEKAAEILKKRTLTNLYNQRPAWLANAHKDLDEAVAAAYGWPADLSDDEVLERLLTLNLKRAEGQ
jgi:type II restriction/modification system DNA methylase subunit YeeA